MILCWWHLRKRCSESMSSAGGAKDIHRAFEKELLGQLWEGKVNAAIELLKGASEWVRNPAVWGRGTHRVPREAASVGCQLPATATGRVMDRQPARVKKSDDYGRCRHAANARG